MAIMSTEDAVEAGELALEWFDSIHGDRENGRVLISYHTLEALVGAAATTL